jgi:hypothetical protein
VRNFVRTLEEDGILNPKTSRVVSSDIAIIDTIQAKAWMDKQAMMKWVDEVWGPYTKDTRRAG